MFHSDTQKNSLLSNTSRKSRQVGRLADYQLLGLPMEQQLRLTLRMRNIVMPHPCTLPHGKFAQEIQAMIKCTF